MKKFRHVGNSPKTVAGKTVTKDYVIELPDNFRHPMFEVVQEKNVRKKFNDIKINKKSKKRKVLKK